MSRFTGEIKGYPGNLNRSKDLKNILSSEAGHLQTLVDNARIHSPGYLLKTMEVDNYQIPRIIKQQNVYEKRDYKTDTGHFHGQPGVLHSFGRNPRFN